MNFYIILASESKLMKKNQTKIDLFITHNAFDSCIIIVTILQKLFRATLSPVVAT